MDFACHFRRSRFARAWNFSFVFGGVTFSCIHYCFICVHFASSLLKFLFQLEEISIDVNQCKDKRRIQKVACNIYSRNAVEFPSGVSSSRTRVPRVTLFSFLVHFKENVFPESCLQAVPCFALDEKKKKKRSKEKRKRSRRRWRRRRRKK